MDKFLLGGSIAAIPFILLVPKALRPKLSFLVVLIVSIVTSLWAVNAFMNGTIRFPIADLPVIGDVTVNIDPLSAIFLLIINLITGCGSFYAVGYLKDYQDKGAMLSLHLVSLNVLHLSMILVTCFQNLFAFLIVWELMAVSSFLLIIFDSDRQETLQAGISYFVQMHLAGIFLMVAFMLFYKTTGDLSFDSIGEYLSNEQHNNMPFFLLLFAGFGIKAGFVPFHSWMPKTYSAAPPHISAIMSGIMTKMGLYGIFRTISLIHGNYQEIGLTLLIVSTISALYGIVNSIMQKDVKKVLSYSSIENIGIIGIGIGTGVIGIGVQDDTLSFFGFSAAVLHLLNHSLFKSLLFFSMGGVYKKIGSNNMEMMGGVIKKMPMTGVLFLIGSVAICALPPFNGFISEFLLYNGLIEGMNATNIPIEITLLLSLISLALIGGLAIYSFTRVFGLTFLGTARTKVVDDAREVDLIMLLPQFILAILLFAGGLFPQFFFRLASKVSGIYVNDFTTYKINTLEALNKVSITMVVFVVLFALICFIRYRLVKKNGESYGPTWVGGYEAFNNRMQYTPGSYAGYVGMFAEGVVKQKEKYEPLEQTDFFPKNRIMEISPEDTIEENMVLKAVRFLRDRLNIFAIIQTGKTTYYIMYAFLFLLVMLVLTFLEIIPNK